MILKVHGTDPFTDPLPPPLSLSLSLSLSLLGFAASNISEVYDAKIFAVATILSSYLIYNSVKVTDNNNNNNNNNDNLSAIDY